MKTRVWLQVVAITALALLFVGFAIAIGASHAPGAISGPVAQALR